MAAGLLRNLIPARTMENFVLKYADAGATHDRIAYRQWLMENGYTDQWRKEFADRRPNVATSEGNHAQAS